MSAVVELVGLDKSYGRVVALRGVDLTIERGEILGYLGPNGAGKTTTIRILLGLLRPSAGRARVFGLDCWRQRVEVKTRLGYLAGDVRLYEGLSGRQLLRLLASLRARPCGFEALAERLGLDLSRRVKAYSKGMRQKLGVIQALMHSPDLLVLDEPTTGLDPLVQQEVYRLLEEERERGATIFFSSHVLSEVERLCDRVAVVRDGRILDIDSEVHRHFGGRLASFELADPDEGEQALRAVGLVPRRRDRELTVQVDDLAPLLRVLAERTVRSLEIGPLTLEDLFLDLYRGEAPRDSRGAP